MFSQTSSGSCLNIFYNTATSYFIFLCPKLYSLFCDDNKNGFQAHPTKRILIHLCMCFSGIATTWNICALPNEEDVFVICLIFTSANGLIDWLVIFHHFQLYLLFTDGHCSWWRKPSCPKWTIYFRQKSEIVFN